MNLFAFYHGHPLSRCLPSAANPELRRMLTIGHGALCMIDTAWYAEGSMDGDAVDDYLEREYRRMLA